jgi:hypothetical protein
MFPRGYLLLIPVWYAVLAALLVGQGQAAVLVHRYSPWFAAHRHPDPGGRLVTMRQKAFFADENGIWLGIVTRRRRSRRQRILLPWSQIARLRITE